ncbi:MAG: hypothetical protein JXR70_14080 [Spirochaetales bacterium]|nr:hypothetical protein [Spirochaetales bacterium]
MRKIFGVFLVSLISFCSCLLILLSDFILLGKIVVLFLVHGGVFFFLFFFFVKVLRGHEKQVEELNFQLEEKRIQLKEQDLHAVERGKDNVVEKSVLGDLPPKLKKLCDNYQKISEETSVFFTKYKSTQDVLDDELATVEENYQSIKSNIDKTFNISDNLATSANKAFSVAEDMQKGIDSVTQSLSKAITTSKILFTQSAKIGKIIEVIREIAEKTHVLSINASIVSARAGSHGKAFGVVAHEIRNLASESDGSIHDIVDEVGEVQRSISSIVDEIYRANEDITNERDVLMAVVGTLQGITLGVEVLRAVSKVANEKTFLQNEIVINIIHQYKKLLVEWEGLEIDQRNIHWGDLEKLFLSDFKSDLSESRDDK